MKYNNYIGIMIAAAGMLGAASCSDFDDYNTAYTDPTASANQTLWENISGNENLSTFAELVKKAGFDDELNTSHYYTVWAPVNSALEGSEYLTADSATLLQRFIQNHVADYSYVATGDMEQRVKMLNNKSYDFTGSGSYILGEVALTSETVPSINGMLYSLSGVSEYLPNIHDFIYEAEGGDSLAAYLGDYEYAELDEMSSVAGPIVDGKPTYIDSVMIEYNQLLNYNLRAYVELEDSSYSVIIPTNEAWVKQYDKVSKYMNYIATTTVQDLESSKSASSIETKTVTVDHTYYKDSLTRMGIVTPLFFNNNDYYNRWTVDEAQEFTDTIYTTTRYKLSNPREILGHATAKEKMSNGWAYIVDSLAMYPWDYIAQEREIDATSYQARVLNGTASRYSFTFSSNDPSEVQGWRDSLEYYEPGTSLRYTVVQPASNFSKPELDIYLPNVYSTTYNFYCVFVPNLDGYTTDVGKANKVDFTLNYCNASGATADWKFSSDGAENPRTSVPFINDPTKIDTMYIGQFTFPVAYAALGSDYRPNIKITSPFSVFGTDARTYTRDLRIAAIIMRPADYDEFLGNNPKEEEE